MQFLPRPVQSPLVLACVLFVALIPLGASTHDTRARTSSASAGVVEQPLHLSARSPARSNIRRRLAEHGAGTYINEMLAERDSALARWPDHRDAPLRVWIQPSELLATHEAAYLHEVRDAFRVWDDLHLPVRFAFTADSSTADVHVTFIDHFNQPISGRTKWVRDDDWWITDADIVLATHHRNGDALDPDAMRAMTLHEVGHLLGLDHTTDSSNIMAPRVRVRALSAADQATVRLLYALPPGALR